MNLETKKQFAIFLLAAGLGLVAAVFTGNYVQTNIQKETQRITKEYDAKKIQPMVQQINVLNKQLKELERRQAEMPKGAAAGGAKSEATPVPKSSLALRTPAGKRAYTVMIDSLSAVGGMINPGDYVDIIGHLNVPNPAAGGSRMISSMLFQNIQILAVNTNLQAPGGYAQQQQARALNITFALTPEEATLMSFVEKNGKMQLILRAPAETETKKMEVATWSTLADYVFQKQGTELSVPQAKGEAKSAGKPEEVKPFIQIFRGGRQQ